MPAFLLMVVSKQKLKIVLYIRIGKPELEFFNNLYQTIFVN